MFFKKKIPPPKIDSWLLGVTNAGFWGFFCLISNVQSYPNCYITLSCLFVSLRQWALLLKILNTAVEILH